MWSSSFVPSIEDDTVRSLSVLEAELAPVSETASPETAINSSAKTECGFTLVPPYGRFVLTGPPVMGSAFDFLNIDPSIEGEAAGCKSTVADACAGRMCCSL